MARDMRSEILLESGTNEIEIMEFMIDGNAFGINVAKVKEIMMLSPIKAMPNAHPAVEGVFKPRETVITVVDLPRYLNLPDSEDRSKDLLIATYFNQMNVAFRVHSVVDISRVSWEAIQKPDKLIYGSKDGVATGLAEINGKLITILDFEKIVAEIEPSTSIQITDVEGNTNAERANFPILIAEDSMLLSQVINECLVSAGYTNLVMTADGQEAWEHLQALKTKPDIKDHLSLVITDIEMPRMDGHRLTKLIKSDPKLQKLPVIIFSSLISEQMYQKGVEVGADEQLSKPEIVKLVSSLDELLSIH